jgi:hypothetical protein
MASPLPNRQDIKELAQTLRVKAMQLSDLDVMIEDYQHERGKLVQEIGKLKALLWELVGDPEDFAALGLHDLPDVPTLHGGGPKPDKK